MNRKARALALRPEIEAAVPDTAAITDTTTITNAIVTPQIAALSADVSLCSSLPVS